MESRLEVLKEQGFPASDKFRQFMESELLQDAARGTILWIDEAGSLSTREMRWTVDFARGKRLPAETLDFSGSFSKLVSKIETTTQFNLYNWLRTKYLR